MVRMSDMGSSSDSVASYTRPQCRPVMALQAFPNLARFLTSPSNPNWACSFSDESAGLRRTSSAWEFYVPAIYISCLSSASTPKYDSIFRLYDRYLLMPDENNPPPVLGRRGREGALHVGARKKA